MAQSVTLSSLGVTAGIGLNPVSKTTIAQITFVTTGSSLDLTLQATLDDFGGAATPVWANISTTHWSSATVTAGDGVFITLLSPIAGLRLSSSTISGTGNLITLKVLQSVTA